MIPVAFVRDDRWLLCLGVHQDRGDFGTDSYC